MSPVVLAVREILHRWKSSALNVIVVAAVTGSLVYFSVNNFGFQKELGRNARDIGSNVVILPIEVDQFAYHTAGGFAVETMPSVIVEQIVEYKASLNHLIPMLERQAVCEFGNNRVQARVVGISASIALPGRPKSPMQKAIKKDTVQLGSALAEKLGVSRDTREFSVAIQGQSFVVSRINKSNGTWQDAVAFMELAAAQSLFNAEEQISRIEAIECTQEQCEQTGLKSDVVLAAELARITDQAVLLRREDIAEARSKLRIISRENLGLLQNMLWAVLAISIMGLSSLNSIQRKSEIGVLQSVGFGQSRVAVLFLLRSVLLTLLGATIGVALGATLCYWQSLELFDSTGKKFSVDWAAAGLVGLIAILMGAVAALLPAMLAAMKNPAELIGRES